MTGSKGKLGNMGRPTTMRMCRSRTFSQLQMLIVRRRKESTFRAGDLAKIIERNSFEKKT